jgi:Zn-dependent protease with chaperone function
MATTSLYPPSPTAIPADLTRASGTYRLRLLLLVASLAFFLLFYLALVLGAAYLTWYVATQPFVSTRGRAQWHPLFNGLGGLACGMLFLFLLKGLFKGRRADRSMLVELKREQQLELFDFIDRLCDEVRAPRPRRVFVTPDVNAAVIYDTSLVNLFIPPKKHLLIGLGLVNSINLTEMKAVLAHEFGHFSQKSLGLGSYVYVSRQILHDIVYARDRWDDFLNWWCRVDLRLSFPAWGLKGLVWTLRKGLAGIYRGINLLDLAMSRQMEFNADDVAVSAAGSDAIVHSLCRLDFANQALNQAAHDLHTAADHSLFTRDMFLHQTVSASWLRQMRKDPKLGLPPEQDVDADGKPIPVFDPAKGDDGIPPMWRSHPPNHEREANAKRHYLRVPIDDRTPWLLFRDADALKMETTKRFYELGLERRESYAPTDSEAVQKFIDAEHAETTYDPKYHGLYNERFINPGQLPAVVPQVSDNEWPTDRIRDFLRQWPGADLEQKMKEYQGRQGDFHLLRGLHSGEYTLKGKTFKLREVDYTAGDVKWLFEMVSKELEENQTEFHGIDAQVFQAHLEAARDLERVRPDALGCAENLLQRYQFHLAVQDLLRTLMADEDRMNGLLKFLSNQGNQLQSADFQEVVKILREIADSLADCVDKAKHLRCPALTNVEEGTSLRKLIWEKDADLPYLDSNPSTIQFNWIIDYLKKQNASQNRVRRVHFKSLGKILTMQETIAKAWLELPGNEIPRPADQLEAESIPPEQMNLP